ncbi:hypothetical protein [Steroidobacter agaridevorans]|uniref:hypothetical protein n=1 Tax=Steroidobacter agaridevorans TaxID=2695856 RepID=UPI001379F148|nr:hypothetical protein [Steroidobacter agaridevorans]
MNSTIQGALDMAPRLAAVELLFLVLWQSRFWVLARQGFSGNPFDHGPWWSVAFFRIWAAWHLPVLLLQTGVSAMFRKPSFAVRVPLLAVSLLLHAVNLVLTVLIAWFFTRR